MLTDQYQNKRGKGMVLQICINFERCQKVPESQEFVVLNLLTLKTN